MTPTTRSQARKQSQCPEEIREYPRSPDRVEEFATMYPAFVTALVLVKVRMLAMTAFTGKNMLISISELNHSFRSSMS